MLTFLPNWDPKQQTPHQNLLILIVEQLILLLVPLHQPKDQAKGKPQNYISYLLNFLLSSNIATNSQKYVIPDWIPDE